MFTEENSREKDDRVVLLVLRHPVDLELLARRELRNASTCVAASDDLPTQRAAALDPRIAEMTFVDQMHSVYSVRDDVVRLKDVINEWIESQAGPIPPYLLRWTNQVEGGTGTSQILDALLLIETFQSLLKRTGAGIVAFRERLSSRTEDQLLREVCRAMSIPVCVTSSAGAQAAKVLNLRRVRGTRRGLGTALYLPERVKSMLIRFRLSSMILRSRIGVNAKCSGSNNVAFLIGSSDDKQVNNAVPVMKELNKQAGWNALALCWMADSARRKLSELELASTSLGAYFPSGRFSTVLAWRKLIRKRCQQDFVHIQDKLVYKGVALKAIVRETVLRFVDVEFFERVLIYHAFKSFLSACPVRAVRLYGGTTLDLGYVGHGVVEEWKASASSPGPLTFCYPVGMDLNCYLGPNDRMYDLNLVGGAVDKAIQKNGAYSAREVVVTGYAQDSILREFRSMREDESLQKLGLGPVTRPCLFYASSSLVRGMIGIAESTRVAQVLFGFARDHARCSMICKPHPSEDPELLVSVWKEQGSPGNVMLLDRSKSAYDCLNVADLIITKFSTIALEAMAQDKPVVSFGLDGEHRFENIFGEGVATFHHEEPFVSFLEHVFLDPGKFREWSQSQIQAQQECLRSRMYRSSDSGAVAIVSELLRRVRDPLAPDLNSTTTVMV
jgi:hypothetical protein